MYTKPGNLRTVVLAASLFAVAIITSPVSVYAKEGKHSAETALVPGSALRLEVQTACLDGNTTFKVKNAGAAWPKTSTFAIYRIAAGKGQMISKRRMRLAPGQQASFRVKASRNPTGKLGIFVRPGWYQRKANYDAIKVCR
jgi:hypothetical protein